MMKICAVYKQPLDKDGKLIEGEKAQCVAYFPRTKDEMIEAITAKLNIGVGELTQVQEGKVWQGDMVKLNEDKWRLTFIYHEIPDRHVFTENLKQYKAAIAKEAFIVLGVPIDYDTINWVNNEYF